MSYDGIMARRANHEMHVRRPIGVPAQGTKHLSNRSVVRNSIRNRFDADKTVHELYGPGAGAVPLVKQLFPHTIVEGSVDRGLLSAAVLNNQKALKDLEGIIHPLVQQNREAFLEKAKADQHPIVVLDIPLLFETGAESNVDYIVVVSAPAAIQRERALRRPGMTSEKFEAILAKQLPDSHKQARADFVVDSSKGLDAAADQVRDIINSAMALQHTVS